MYPLEILLALVLLALLVAQGWRRMSRKVPLALFALALFTLLLQTFLDQLRWQMASAYLLFLVLSLLLLKRSHSHAALRSIGIALGGSLLGLAVALALALPIVTLPAPDGPHVVGSRSFSLVDGSRTQAYFGSPDEPREIYLQLWYPGAIDPVQPPPSVRTLWQELYRGPRDPVTLLAGYMRGIATHTYQDIPLARADAPYPAIVFSHGMGMTAEGNTLLMEHLASHGYVVVGISHTGMTLRAVSSRGQAMFPNPDRFQAVLAEGSVDEAAEFAARASRAATAQERAEIVFDLGERATSINEQIGIRAADIRLVIDAITGRRGGPRGLAELLDRVDHSRIGLLGMSFGGATAIDVCKTDARCRAGVSLDGGLFGQYLRRPLQAPFLSMISAGNKSYDEPLLLNSTSDYYEVLVEGARHGDFSDMTFLLPVMKWLGANGPIDSMRMVDIVNTVSLEFFNHYLRGGPPPRFDEREFPELRITTNAHAER